MTTEFQHLQADALRLRSTFSARDQLYANIARIFHFEWSDPPGGDWVKATMAPTGYNAVLGAVRLMTSTEPQISAAGDKQVADRIEKAAKAMWSGAGRIAMRPPHYDLIFSGVLFGEMVASVSRTSDLLDIAEETGSKGQIARARYIAREAPYLFTSYNPATCYPDRDELGLRGVLRTYLTTYGALVDQWGLLALRRIVPGAGDFNVHYDRYTTCEVWDWVDYEQRCVWIANGDPIYHEDHELPFMPVAQAIVEGSELFPQPEQQRLPLLYAYYKSGLWQRENLSLTAIFTLIQALATSPQLVLEGAIDDEKVEISRDVPGGIVKLRSGQKLMPLVEKVLDPAQMTGLTLTQQYAEESTVPKQALGAPPDHPMAFSALSLLVQAGRLPLMGVKQVGGQMVGYLLNNALRWYRDDGQGVEFYNLKAGEAVDIAPNEIPERAVVTVGLEPDLPQDKMNLANIAEALVRSGLVTREWARENILTIGQSVEMDRGRYNEQLRDTQFELVMRKLTAEVEIGIEKAKQAALAPPPQAGQPGPGGPGGPSALGPPGPGANGQMPAGMGGPGMGGAGPAPVSPYPEEGIGEGQPLNGPLPTDGGGQV